MYKDGLRPSCKACRKAAAAEYYLADKDRIDARNKAYRAANAESVNAQERRWREANKERHAATTKAWAEEHKEHRSAQAAARYAADPAKHLERNRAWYEANKGKYSETVKRWQEANAEKVGIMRRNAASKRRARMRDQDCGCVTAQTLEEVIVAYGPACVYCGGPFEDIDHVQPIARGGLHCVANLVPACARCNRSKLKKTLAEWLEQYPEYGDTVALTRLLACPNGSSPTMNNNE
ncbi:HNH endonuclease [Sinomonas albida]|uniref:HNH endonuclease n=1 Tax=Sinomonas albida TaxID=369942 RepID=UPI0010A87834|nr:HNH endonuclease signature motif containing protein [Sinomonas albida]